TAWPGAAAHEADRVVDEIERFARGTRASVTARHIQSPAELGRGLGLRGGNIMHVEMSLDQMLAIRPTPALTVRRMTGATGGRRRQRRQREVRGAAGAERRRRRRPAPVPAGVRPPPPAPAPAVNVPPGRRIGAVRRATPTIIGPDLAR